MANHSRHFESAYSIPNASGEATHFKACSPPYDSSTSHSKLRELSAGGDIPTSGQFPSHRSSTPLQTVNTKDLLPPAVFAANRRLSSSQIPKDESDDEESTSPTSYAPAQLASSENEDTEMD